jgi:hypothetical protein
MIKCIRMENFNYKSRPSATSQWRTRGVERVLQAFTKLGSRTGGLAMTGFSVCSKVTVSVLADIITVTGFCPSVRLKPRHCGSLHRSFLKIHFKQMKCYIKILLKACAVPRMVILL